MNSVRLIIGALACFELASQTISPPGFDVASVKPNYTAAPPVSNFPLGPGNAYNPNGGYFSATNYPVVTYIAFAYRIMGDQAKGFLAQLPKWATEDRYDIQARVAGNPTKDEMRLLMRSLLADRFLLAMHEETKEVPGFGLMPSKAGKLGPQIQPHPPGSPCPTDAPPSAVAEDQRFPLLCGGFLEMNPSAARRIRLGARNVTMDFIAKSLTGGLASSRLLVDRTGLSGTFDFNLEWTPETSGPMKPGAEAQLDTQGPTFEQALREQLGLRLVYVKVSQSVIVLDRLERPSGN